MSASWEMTEAQAKALKRANDKLGLRDKQRLSAFLHEGGEEQRYTFVCGELRRSITDKQLAVWRYTDPAIVAVTGKVLNPPTAAKYRQIRQDLNDAQIELKVSPEESRAGQGRAWLTLHLERAPAPVEAANADAAWAAYVASGLRFNLDAAMYLPYRRASDQRLVVFTDGLRGTTFLLHSKESPSPRELGSALRAAGCTWFADNCTVNGKGTTRSAWKLPADVSVPEDLATLAQMSTDEADATDEEPSI